MWPYNEEGSTIDAVKHYGKGQSIFCAVGNVDVTVDEEQIVNLKIELDAAANQLMKKLPSEVALVLDFDKLGEESTFLKKQSF
jgi:hypothetical protein